MASRCDGISQYPLVQLILSHMPFSLAFSDSFGIHTAALASLVLVPGFANQERLCYAILHLVGLEWAAWVRMSMASHCWYFYHLGQCASCLALLELLAACALVIPAPSELNISVSGCAGIWICNFFSSVLQGGSRMFCPSAGQDAAGVGNAGPNRRHQTERDRKGKHGAVLGDLDHWSPHSSS